MNSKIKNYVDVLFKGIPNTKKAQELKEEILSTLNDHFEAHIAEGKSENQAYTESLGDLGDIDELLRGLEPEKDLKEKIDAYRAKRAKFTSISVILYILSVVCVIVLGSLSEVFGIGDEDKMGIIGVVLMFILIAIATGLMVYIHMSKPQDVSEYLVQNQGDKILNYNGSNKSLRTLAAVMKLYWVIVLAIYLLVSFSTNAWHITWLVWCIAAALKNALYAFLDVTDEDVKRNNN